jgi:hypothetical protein
MAHGITHTDGTVKLSTWITQWPDSSGPQTGGGLGTRGAHHLYFYTNGSTKMQVTPDGNVGIGTGEPKAKLDVNGTFMIKGVKPMKCWVGTVNRDIARVRTPFSAADWVPVMAGFIANAPDHGADKNAGFHCYFERYDGAWYVQADMYNYGSDDVWTVQVIFIRRELVEGDF